MENLDSFLKYYNNKVKFFYECLSLFVLADSDGVDVDLDENVRDQLIRTLDSCKEVYHMTQRTESLYESVLRAYHHYKYGSSMTYAIDCLIYEVGNCHFDFKGEEYEEN